jgi:hypothetical protein
MSDLREFPIDTQRTIRQAITAIRFQIQEAVELTGLANDAIEAYRSKVEEYELKIAELEAQLAEYRK